MRATAVALVALVVLLAGCGGGGGGPASTATPGPTPTGEATATTPPPTATATQSPDPAPAWVDEDGSVDGAALADHHAAALPSTYRLTVLRSAAETLTLYEGPDAARLDVGERPRAGLYDDGGTSARLRSDADPPYAAEFGSAPSPTTDAAYAAVRGTYPGRYLAVGDLQYRGQSEDGGHAVRFDGVTGRPDAPAGDGTLVDLAGAATVGPGGYVRSLQATETVVTAEGERVERSVTVRVTPVDDVPGPAWLDAGPRLRGAVGEDRRTFAVTSEGGSPVDDGTTLTLRNRSTILGTTTLNGTLAPGTNRSLALIVENGTERLVAAANGTAPTANATRLPADAYLVVETDAYVVRVGVAAERDRASSRDQVLRSPPRRALAAPSR